MCVHCIHPFHNGNTLVMAINLNEQHRIQMIFEAYTNGQSFHWHFRYLVRTNYIDLLWLSGCGRSENFRKVHMCIYAVEYFPLKH